MRQLFFWQFLITFWHYYYAEYVFDYFYMIFVFQIFFISRTTEIVIVLNFWLGVFMAFFWHRFPCRQNGWMERCGENDEEESKQGSKQGSQIASQISRGEWAPLSGFFSNSIKTVFHNLNQMLLVLSKTEYNKVWLTSIKSSIFKRYIIVIFDILKCCICHTVPYRWGPLCHSIRYILTGCVKDTL